MIGRAASLRSNEVRNLVYLSQANIYGGPRALSPCLVPPQTRTELERSRSGNTVNGRFANTVRLLDCDSPPSDEPMLSVILVT